VIKHQVEGLKLPILIYRLFEKFTCRLPRVQYLVSMKTVSESMQSPMKDTRFSWFISRICYISHSHDIKSATVFHHSIAFHVKHRRRDACRRNGMMWRNPSPTASVRTRGGLRAISWYVSTDVAHVPSHPGIMTGIIMTFIQPCWWQPLDTSHYINCFSTLADTHRSSKTTGSVDKAPRKTYPIRIE